MSGNSDRSDHRARCAQPAGPGAYGARFRSVEEFDAERRKHARAALERIRDTPDYRKTSRRSSQRDCSGAAYDAESLDPYAIRGELYTADNGVAAIWLTGDATLTRAP